MEKLTISDIAPLSFRDTQFDSLSLSADAVLTAFNEIIDTVNKTPEPKNYDEEIKTLSSGINETKVSV